MKLTFSSHTPAVAFLLLSQAVLGADFFVSPGGSPAGNGSISQPWDIQTMMVGPAAVLPGDTVYLRGGIYQAPNRDTFYSTIHGDVNLPVTIRPYHDERVIIDGGISVDASPWIIYRDLEVMNSDTRRITGTPAQPVGFSVYAAPNSKFINNIVHDTQGAFGYWVGASDSELYGNLIYYNGYYDPGTRNHGHGIYAQNATGEKHLNDNIVFSQFSHGFHIYTEGGSINNFFLDGNIAFNNGSLVNRFERNILVGGGGTGGGAQKAQNPSVTKNYTYFSFLPDARGDNNFGYYPEGAGCANLVLDDNYFVAPYAALSLHDCTYSSVHGNTIYGPTRFDPGVSEADFPGNTFIPVDGRPTGYHVFVRPNRYEVGRANIAVFNWDRADFVPVDIGNIGLLAGDRYEVLDAQNFFGPPVLAGEFQSNLISLPMTSTDVAPTVGDVPFPPFHTDKEFGAFIIRRARVQLGAAPQVSITSPAAEAQVAGTITVEAAASDDVGIAGVQFRLDGLNLNSEVGTAPYRISLNTDNLTKDAHTLTAVARDGDGNFTISSPITIHVVTNPDLAGLALASASTTGGTSIQSNRVDLTQPAPPGGVAVLLRSSNSSFASVPASVTVLEGATSGFFTISTAQTFALQSATITATYRTVEKSGQLTITPTTSVASVVLSAGVVNGGNPVPGNRVVLSSPAPASGVVVTLSSSSPSAASVPGSVTIPAGLSEGLFDIATYLVTDRSTAVITATLGGDAHSSSLTIDPVQLNSLTLTAREVDSGLAITNNIVQLTRPAPAGGVSVVLSSDIPWAHVPATAQIPAGLSTASFNILTDPASTLRSGVITASLGGLSQSLSLTVYPTTPITLTPTPSVVSPGAYITVSWTVPAGRPLGDWIGLFAVGAPNTAYGSYYSTNASTSGSRIFVAPAQTGQYEFRYLLNNGFTDVARSSAVTVGTSVVLPVISAVQSSNVTTSTASITWASNVPTDSQVEYGTGTGYGSSTVLDTAKLTTHTVPLTGLTPATQYHFRVKGTDALGNPTVSGDYTLTTLTASQDYTLTASPVSVSPGGTITASWTAPAGRPTVDWIGLFASGASNTSYLAYKFTGGATSGSGTFVAPLQAGQYEFRYLLNNGFTDVVRSSAVTVGSGVVLPVNSAIQSSNITAGSATITWTSNVAIDSQVEYGLTSAYGLQSTLDPAKVTAHTVQLTGLTSATQYHFRVKGTDGSGNAAVSGDFTFTTLLTSQTYTLTATPPSVNPGSPLSLSWTAPAGRPSTDWLGLFAKGAANTVTPLWWQYTNGSSSGTVNVTAPSLGGQYEFRYFQQNGYTLAVTSNTVTVVVPTNYSVTGTPSTITAGGTLTVSWAAPAGRPGTDWVGLFNVGAANTSYLWYRYTGGTTGGSTPVTAPSQPGQYEFRYLLNGGFTDAARSAPISVQ